MKHACRDIAAKKPEIESESLTSATTRCDNDGARLQHTGRDPTALYTATIPQHGRADGILQ